MIEHVDNWFTVLSAAITPVSVCGVIVFALARYYAPISRLIENVRTVEGAGVKAEIATIVDEQKDAHGLPSSSLSGANEIRPQLMLDIRRPAREVAAELLPLLKESAKTIGNPDRDFAAYFLGAWACEWAYRLIFGTQLAFVDALRAGPLSDAIARGYFNESVSKGNTQTFDEWMSFLTNTTQLVARSQGKYAHGSAAAMFLAYLARENYSLQKAW